MHVLVVNCGSTSLKTAIVDAESGQRVGAVVVDRIGQDAGAARWSSGVEEPLVASTHLEALDRVLERLLALAPGAIGGVGHRVVHGGDRFRSAVRITDEVEATIEELTPLAPLHNPANLAGIRAARAKLPDVPHIAVFDTAFHATLPRRAREYALPRDLAERHGIRRYGFHGTSHEFVARRAAAAMDCELRDIRLITCHLGGGCSVAAVEYGRSVETSMGLTPLEGLVMGTRSGDLDPGVLLHLMRAEGLDADALDSLLNRASGLSGLSGVGRDMRDIEERAADGDEACRLAIHVFTHRLRKYIGAYAAVMGGVDAIVFTAGIGQNSALIRHRVAQRLDFLGARLDEDRNRDARVSADAPVVVVSADHSRVKLLAVETDEEYAIAAQVRELALEHDQTQRPMTIPIAVSARHIHLTQEAVEALFGAGHTLTPLKPLSQPGQFACEETLTLVGPKRNIERVRVLGPVRPKCQVEISRTDEFFLGLDAPVRRSGDVDNSPGITLVGPEGRRLTIESGVICAWRHIHMTPEDAERFDVSHGDIVEVAIQGGPRELVFGDVLVRVKSSYALEMHIDTDEANAAELGRHAEGLLVATSGSAQVLRKRTRFSPTV